jgi:hypothetical protein
MPISVTLSRGDLDALPNPVAAGASALRAVLMRASECFAQHHGARAADPGEFEPRVDQAVAASARRPSLPLRLVHRGC